MSDFYKLICSVLKETELYIILLGDRALNAYDSFSGKMGLKGHFSVTLRNTQFICSGLRKIDLQAFLSGVSFEPLC